MDHIISRSYVMAAFLLVVAVVLIGLYWSALWNLSVPLLLPTDLEEGGVHRYVVVDVRNWCASRFSIYQAQHVVQKHDQVFVVVLVQVEGEQYVESWLVVLTYTPSQQRWVITDGYVQETWWDDYQTAGRSGMGGAYFMLTGHTARNWAAAHLQEYNIRYILDTKDGVVVEVIGRPYGQTGGWEQWIFTGEYRNGVWRPLEGYRQMTSQDVGD